MAGTDGTACRGGRRASGIADRLRGAFNHGYSDYATSYRACTPSAKAAAEILTRDAARLARDIERRFGS